MLRTLTIARCALSFVLLVLAEKKEENCPDIFFEIPRDDRPTKRFAPIRITAAAAYFSFSLTAGIEGRAFEKKKRKGKRGKNNVKLAVPRVFPDPRYTENVVN